MDDEKQGIFGTAQAAVTDAAKSVINTTSDVATGAVQGGRKAREPPQGEESHFFKD